jgi:c-di-GMP phosphodiesterase Gmr
VERRVFDINIGRFGENGDLFLLTMVDKTAEARSRVDLRREMLNDSLTGFCNRSGFEEEIESLLADSTAGHHSPQKFAVLIIDLARFSRINESVGVMAGDELIITVAKRLKARTRTNEILARLGGNEFALFVRLEDDEDESAPAKIAERLVDAFNEPCNLSHLQIQMECAVSAACGSTDKDDPVEVVRHAQLALKKAKVTKKFELYCEGEVNTARRRFSLETELRQALQQDELELHYQPLIDLESGQLNGFEALARWKHPELGVVSPVDFIPVAEESGLIVPLGQWAVLKAAATLSEWDDQCNTTLPIRISVNMSAVQMQYDDVPAAVEHALGKAKISGNRLTLELTESAIVSDPEGAKRTLEALKNLNVHLAMDDFGTGYSNLACLQQLPLDVLKIDRSFVTDMIDNKDKTAIVQTILSLAGILGMRTTAEGVETPELSDLLRGLGCTVGQGYYYARPLQSSDALAYVTSRLTN